MQGRRDPADHGDKLPAHFHDCGMAFPVAGRTIASSGACLGQLFLTLPMLCFGRGELIRAANIIWARNQRGTGGTTMIIGDLMCS